MKRQTKIVIALLSIVLVLAGSGTAFLIWGLPRLAERYVRKLLPHAEAFLDRQIRVERIALVSLSHLRLQGVTIRQQKGADDRLLKIQQLDVHYVTKSVLDKKIRLLRVVITGPALELVRHADGTDNFGDIASKIKRMTLREKGSGAARPSKLLAYFERQLPVILVNGGRVTFLDRSQWLQRVYGKRELSVTEINLRAHNPSQFADERQLQIKGSASLHLSSFAPFQYTGSLDGQKRTAKIMLTFPRALSIVVKKKLLRVRGILVENRREFELRGVTIAHQLKDTTNTILTADSLRVRLRSGTIDAKTPTSLIKRILRRIDQLQLKNPVFYVNRYGALLPAPQLLRGQLHDPSVDDQLSMTRTPDEKPLTRRRRSRRRRRGTDKNHAFRFRNLTVRVFKGVHLRFGHLKSLLFAQVRRFPLRELRIIGGAIRPETDAQRQGEPHRISNFNALFSKDRQTGKLTFRVDFVSHLGSAQQNRISGQADPRTKDFQLNAEIPKLQIYDYRDAFPALITVAKNSVVERTKMELRYSGPDDRLTIKGAVFYNNLHVVAKWLAKEPLRDMSLGFRANCLIDFKTPRLKIEPSSIFFNKLRFVLSGEVTKLFEAPTFNVALSLDRTKLQTVLDAMPKSLIPLLQGAEINGTFSFYFKSFLDTQNYNTLKYKVFADLKNDFLVRSGSTLDFERLLGTFVHKVEEPGGKIYLVGIGESHPNFTPLDKISPYMEKVVTTTEDGNFWNHKGFSPHQIRLTVIANLKRGRFYRGASTITQQLVKNLFLRREKTISRKLQEVLITWQIEKYLTKQRIMELYLNIIEMGPGIYGITQAAEHYFGKKPAELTLVDCAFIASLLSNPKKHYWQFKRGEVTEGWRRKLKRYVTEMYRRKKVTDEELKAAHPFSPVFKGKQPKTPRKTELKPNPY